MKAVIMAGGHGTRFWPVSRKNLPKQFLSITGPRSMLQETVSRLHPTLKPADIHIVCAPEFAAQARSQAPELAARQVIVEPAPRNTAACIGLSALHLRRQFPDEVMVALPADHVIQKTEEFRAALESAQHLAREGWLVTFGIEPAYPATGYGYVERGTEIRHFNNKSAYRVTRFTEKPDLETATEFLRNNRHYWNSGIFVWSLQRILDEIQKHMPALHQILLEIHENPDDQERALGLFSRLEKVSIDHGVMEKAEKVAVLPCDLGWSDVGGWSALADVCSGDEDNIISNALHIGLDSRDCIVHASTEKMIALIGVEDLVIVDTPDALLICRRGRTEEVKRAVEELKKRGLEEHL
ncbi:MAG: mannose-1-phosphate guanylyltransferase [Acidobacteriota bacterium]